MKKAVLYIRVSTDEQANTGYSQRYQEETLQRYCTLKGMTVQQTFFEDHSAKTFDRPKWQQLLVLLKKHRGIADVVLFTKWDRFSRNTADAYKMISTLNKMGVDQQAIEQPLDLSVPENKLMLAFYLAQPEVENDRRAINVSSGMRRAKKEGRWMGVAPPGYRNRNLDGHKSIVICPTLSPIMQWVFEKVAKGDTPVRQLLKMAVAKGLVSRNGTPIGRNAFWAAIRNPCYAGFVKIPAHKGEDEQLIRGNHEALISELLFQQAQDALDVRKKLNRPKLKLDARFPLRGFLQCPTCGKLVTASSSKGRKHYYSYYHCTSTCNFRHTADAVNYAFANELSRWKPHRAVKQLYKLVLQDIYTQGDKGRQKEIKQTRDELSRIEARKVRVRKMRIDGDLEMDDYMAEKKDCEQSLVRLEGKLAELMATANVTEKIDDAIEVLEHMDEKWNDERTSMTWRREFLGSMFPEKLVFTGAGFRTARVNEVAQLMFNLGAAFSQIKMGQVKDISDLSHQVNPLGLPFSA